MIEKEIFVNPVLLGTIKSDSPFVFSKDMYNYEIHFSVEKL